MQIKDPQNYDNHILNEIDADCAEMNEIDRKFLNGVIRQIKPKKILEVGVAAGSSSVVILNAIKDIDGALLYSIDYNKMHYNNALKKETGFIVKEKYPNLLSKYKLFTGGVSAKFLDEIGYDIDLCLLDTAHANPGEFLDFLMVLPYLKRNAVIIIHDVCMHTYKEFKECYTCGVLFSCIDSKQKIIAKDIYFNHIGNIGLAVISDDIMSRIYDYFHLLTLPWKYLLSDEDIFIITNFLSKHYDKKYIDLFKNICSFYNTKDKDLYSNVIDMYNNLYVSNDTNSNISLKNKIINTLAWWIPIRKWRDNFRNKFKK